MAPSVCPLRKKGDAAIGGAANTPSASGGKEEKKGKEKNKGGDRPHRFFTKRKEGGRRSRRLERSSSCDTGKKRPWAFTGMSPLYSLSPEARGKKEKERKDPAAGFAANGPSSITCSEGKEKRRRGKRGRFVEGRLKREMSAPVCGFPRKGKGRRDRAPLGRAERLLPFSFLFLTWGKKRGKGEKKRSFLQGALYGTEFGGLLFSEPSHRGPRGRGKGEKEKDLAWGLDGRGPLPILAPGRGEKKKKKKKRKLAHSCGLSHVPTYPIRPPLPRTRWKKGKERGGETRPRIKRWEGV